MKSILSFFAASTLLVSAEPDGVQLFTTNCSACHMLDEMVVGPSLVEISKLYDGKPDEFIKWAMAPQKKRPDTIEMPSMVHVGEEGLRAIYQHAMQISKGVKEKPKKKGDPFASSPVHTAIPQVQRIFMPDAGPAAIAIALDKNTSLCWDAGTSRLRYAWTGGFIDGYPYWQGNGSSLAKLVGIVKYSESDSPFANASEAQFSGYRMENGLPIFQYLIGESKITESFSSAEGGFKRSFTVSPLTAKSLILSFPSNQNVEYSSDKGSWFDSKLTLTPAEAAAFTINISFK